jgi:hypothetical protein
MLRERLRRPTTRDFVIVPDGMGAMCEAWVERRVERRGFVFVELIQDSGERLRLRLRHDCADWLEIVPGQIVGLDRLPRGRDRDLAVVGESVHACG